LGGGETYTTYRIKVLVMCSALINPEASVKRIMYSQVSNKYVHWGRKQEAAARLKYKIVLRKQYPDIKIRECGLFVGTNTPFLGASPDGIIEYTDDGKKMKGVLEILSRRVQRGL